MAVLTIIKAGDPVLKATAKPVTKVNKHIKKLLDDMAETMYAAEGVGLAAPQVNESLQLIVLDDGNGSSSSSIRKSWKNRTKPMSIPKAA